MEITGRLTADAEIKTLKDERQLVRFSIAINDYFKTKDGEGKQVTTYVDCAYWINTGISARLKKGTVVSLFGRISVNAYTGMDGTAKATLAFHASDIKVVAQPKGNVAAMDA